MKKEATIKTKVRKKTKNILRNTKNLKFKLKTSN